MSPTMKELENKLFDEEHYILMDVEMSVKYGIKKIITTFPVSLSHQEIVNHLVSIGIFNKETNKEFTHNEIYTDPLKSMQRNGIAVYIEKK